MESESSQNADDTAVTIVETKMDSEIVSDLLNLTIDCVATKVDVDMQSGQLDNIKNKVQNNENVNNLENIDLKTTDEITEMPEEQALKDAVLQQKPLEVEQQAAETQEKPTEFKTHQNETPPPPTPQATIIAQSIVPPQQQQQQQSKPISLSTPASPAMLAVRYSELSAENDMLSHVHCLAQQEQQRKNYEQQLEQLRAALAQKDNMITLYQRENAILEKEKQAFRKEKEFATKEKETTVIKFAMKEKLLIDAKKEKEAVEKQLAEAKKEIKNVSTRFQAVNEEKSRITYMVDEKCNEVRKYQRECEKFKSEISQLESRLKYHINKLNIEVEAKAALEKKLEEERNAPNKLEEKANEKLKMECDANTILLKHEITRKSEALEQFTKDNQRLHESVKLLQQQLDESKSQNTQCCNELEELREAHNSVENAYSEEMLNSAKLRGQLEELQVLKTQHTLNEEQIESLNAKIKDLETTLKDNAHDLQQLHTKEQDLLSINKEMCESIVQLQNEICLLKSKAQGIEAENKLLKQEKLSYDTKYLQLEKQLSAECAEKNEERQLLARHLSEKTKLYELTKVKLENLMGEYEAANHKHATVVKELQRDLQKYKKGIEQPYVQTRPVYCSKCENALNGFTASVHSETTTATTINDSNTLQRTHSRTSSHGSGSRRASDTSEPETVASSSATAIQQDLTGGPSKKVLVERILRLQQASARQTEKIDFLENHTLSLVAELQKKSKVVQYYLLRDQTAGALTSTRSDQNKSELAKYGNGVMAAIYGGVKNESKGMTLELSLEINKKLQTVLEDTLLKNITLKENLDVLGLEVDNLTRKLRQLETTKK